jgi:quercetin dioxygenase-like cupin family protein
MEDFPRSVRNVANRIDPGSQYTEGIEGWVFDGVDGSQVAFWTCRADRSSAAHVHPYDEYLVVVAGMYTVILGEREIELRPGGELVIPQGILHSGRCVAGTRTIHHFAGRRAERGA